MHPRRRLQRHDVVARVFHGRLEDTAINVLVLVALGWSLRRQAVAGKVLALLILGVGIVVLNVRAAREVWELAHEEHLAARALAGEDLD